MEDLSWAGRGNLLIHLIADMRSVITVTSQHKNHLPTNIHTDHLWYSVHDSKCPDTFSSHWFNSFSRWFYPKQLNNKKNVLQYYNVHTNTACTATFTEQSIADLLLMLLNSFWKLSELFNYLWLFLLNELKNVMSQLVVFWSGIRKHINVGPWKGDFKGNLDGSNAHLWTISSSLKKPNIICQ